MNLGEEISFCENSGHGLVLLPLPQTSSEATDRWEKLSSGACDRWGSPASRPGDCMPEKQLKMPTSREIRAELQD